MEPDTGLLASVLRDLGLSPAMLSPLAGYVAAVERDADRLGLVSEAGVEEFVGRHVAESLLFAAVVPPVAGARWVDVGSGAGLPGIPLAIAYPETSFTLVEPQQRRAGFLELTVEDLGLDNVVVEARRIQQVRDRFDVAVTRAFSSEAGSGADPAVLELMRAATVPGGRVVVQIARNAAEPAQGQIVTLPALSVDLEVRFLSMAAD